MPGRIGPTPRTELPFEIWRAVAVGDGMRNGHKKRAAS